MRELNVDEINEASGGFLVNGEHIEFLSYSLSEMDSCILATLLATAAVIAALCWSRED